MNPTLTFLVRDTHIELLVIPLYDFLKIVHCNSGSEDIPWECLQVLVDGKELLPTVAGNA